MFRLAQPNCSLFFIFQKMVGSFQLLLDDFTQFVKILKESFEESNIKMIQTSTDNTGKGISVCCCLDISQGHCCPATGINPWVCCHNNLFNCVQNILEASIFSSTVHEVVMNFIYNEMQQFLYLSLLHLVSRGCRSNSKYFPCVLFPICWSCTVNNL